MRAYRLAEVADILGTCRETIYRRVIAGDIPCNRSLGPKLWRIPGYWVEDYLKCTTVEASHTSNNTTSHHYPSAAKCNELRGGRRGKQGVLKP